MFPRRSLAGEFHEAVVSTSEFPIFQMPNCLVSRGIIQEEERICLITH